MSIRSICVTLAVIVSLTGCAKTGSSDVLDLFTPTPIAVVLKIGGWLFRNDKKVFEVRVEGRGATPDQARENAFRKAVEQAVGSLNLRQSEKVDGNIILDRQLIYSSGFVEEYKEIKIEQSANGTWIIQMDIWVKHSSIADGLMGQPVTQNSALNGNKLTVMMSNRDREIETSLALLQAVLDPWPLQALELTHGAISFRYTESDKVTVEIAWVKTKPSEKYKKSLHEVLDRIKGNKSNKVSMVQTQDNETWFGDKRAWYIKSKKQMDLMMNVFGRKTAKLRISFYSGNHKIHSICEPYVPHYVMLTNTEFGYDYLYILPMSAYTTDYQKRLFYITRELLSKTTQIKLDLALDLADRAECPQIIHMKHM